MSEKTSDPAKVYSWAASAIIEEMTSCFGFDYHRSDAPEDSSVLIFKREGTTLLIVLPEDKDGFLATQPIQITEAGGPSIMMKNVDRRINLGGVTASKNEVRDYIKRRLSELFSDNK